MSSEDLVAYLRARLDEEGQIARTVFDGHRVNNPDHESHGELAWPLPTVRRRYQDCNWLGGVEFLEAFNPARVLADIEAKRKIIELFEAMQAGVEAADGTILAGAAKVRLGAYRNALLVLVQPYSSRPDFNEDWRTP